MDRKIHINTNLMTYLRTFLMGTYQLFPFFHYVCVLLTSFLTTYRRCPVLQKSLGIILRDDATVILEQTALGYVKPLVASCVVVVLVLLYIVALRYDAGLCSIFMLGFRED